MMKRISIIISMLIIMTVFISCGYSYYGCITDSLFVFDDEIYVLGYQRGIYSESENENKFWRNQTIGNLEDALLYYLYNDSTYMVAKNYDNDSYYYYSSPNNPQKVNLIGDISKITGLFVENGNVYISGWYYDSDYNNKYAVYWINGVRYEAGNGIPKDITFYNNNVYMAGSVLGEACYWKNDTKTIIFEGIDASTAESILLYNNGIYIAGSYNNENAFYWSNGILHELGQGWTTSIAINNGKVYVSGSKEYLRDDRIGCIWIDGSVKEIKGTYEITDIAFKNSHMILAGYDRMSVEGMFGHTDVYFTPYLFIDFMRVELENN